MVCFVTFQSPASDWLIAKPACGSATAKMRAAIPETTGQCGVAVIERHISASCKRYSWRLRTLRKEFGAQHDRRTVSLGTNRANPCHLEPLGTELPFRPYTVTMSREIECAELAIRARDRARAVVVRDVGVALRDPYSGYPQAQRGHGSSPPC